VTGKRPARYDESRAAQTRRSVFGVTRDPRISVIAPKDIPVARFQQFANGVMRAMRCGWGVLFASIAASACASSRRR
jgi:hypothetical protein